MCSLPFPSRMNLRMAKLSIMLSLASLSILHLSEAYRSGMKKEMCERMCPNEGIPAPMPGDTGIEPKICPTTSCPPPTCPSLPPFRGCPPCPSRNPAPYPNASCSHPLHCPTPCPEPACPPPLCPPPRCPTPVCPEPQCPELNCPAAPRIPPCPPAICPEPVCPEPRCPPPVCPKTNCSPTQCPPQSATSPCPKCPDCSKTIPSLSCPQPICPKPVCPMPKCLDRCPDCPKLPKIPPCPACPTPSCPTSVCPECPNQSTRSFQGGVPACSSCLWKVLVTYDHFQGFGFYKAYNLKLTWHESNTTCTNDGGHLAVINSQEEADILKMLFQKSQLSGWIHIGYHDLFHEGQHMTVLGQPLSKSGYVKWLPGQPDNFANNEDCGTIEHRALLNDGNCDWRVGFICEVPEKKVLGL